MAVSVVSYSGDLPVLGWPKRDTPRQRIGLDNAELQRGLRTRIRALVDYWEDLRNCSVPRRPYSGSLPSWKEALNAKDVTRRDLFKPCGTARPPAIVPPPTYEESLADLPPDYTDTATTAAVCTRSDVKDSADFNGDQKLHPESRSLPSDFDVSEIDGIRSYANKKAAKKAAKAAQQAKWADSDNEENKDEGADGGDGGSGGGDGGSGAGGDGGDPPGGGDGGDDDWWNTGNSKKDKKKKKKNAWAVRCLSSIC
jgi:hypothetical protein